VVATARNERNRPVDDLPSEWEKLGIEKYKELWGRFELHELPAPENRAVSELLAAAAQAAGIKTEGSLAEIAETNDRTFRNPVENLERLRNQQAALTMDSFVPTMRGTWESRYLAVRKRYGVTAAHLYDGVDLLRQVRVPLRERSVLMAAQMVAGGRGWQRWWQVRKLGQVLRALDKAERILEPRDGQIEAKGSRADLNRYFEPLCQRLPSTFEASGFVGSLSGLLLSAYERRNYVIMLGLVNTALQASDKVNLQAALFSLKGVALSALGRKEEAVAFYDAALAIKPDFHEALSNKGVALSALDRNEEAIAAYDATLALKPDKHEALYNKGIALSALGRKEEAIAAYDQALAIKPDYHEALFNKGVALSALGRQEEAIAAYDQALAIKPDDHEALNNKGVALSALGRKEEAIAAYDQALAIKPDNHEALNNKGNALGELGRKEEAIAAYDQALAIKPDSHEALNNKGLALSDLGRKEEAIAAFDAALAFKPDKHEALSNKGVALSALGRKGEAITAYNAALAFKPYFHEAFYNKACCLALFNQSDDALTCLQKAIELEGGTEYIEMAKTDADFDSLLHDPRFQALITAAE
jgi:tetratricopeptide (TPR) repeat protein